MDVDAPISRADADLAHALFERHHAEVYAYLCRMLGDAAWAEDLAQETFLRAFAARTSLARVQNPRAWLYRVATNLALNALKRHRRFAWLPWHAGAERRAVQRDPAFVHCPDAARIFMVDEVVQVYEQDPPAEPRYTLPEGYAAWPRYHDAAGYSAPHPPEWQVERQDAATVLLRAPGWPRPRGNR